MAKIDPNIRFGDIAVIVHYKERHLHHSTREVRFYAGAFLVFMLFGALWVAGDAPDLIAVLRKLSENHLVPILEFIMITLWVIRLGSEVRSIDHLFDH